MTIPNPLLSGGDIVEVQNSSYEIASLIWNTWSQDPIKAVVLQTILSCQFGLGNHARSFREFISAALGQNRVCILHYP